MKNLYKILTAVYCIFLINADLHAQGCVAVRQMGGINAMSASSSYNLGKGDFQVGANYRYFHSFRHFVGDVEQPQRQTLGNAVNIYSHALDINVSYGLTSRIQLNASVPFVHNERSQTLTLDKDATNKALTRYSVRAKGLGDIRLGINYWVFSPEKSHKGNLMIGAGIKLATGAYGAKDDYLQTDGSMKNLVVDQAIQPGDGGIGFSLEFQAFRQLHHRIYGFANAYYMLSPQESNGIARSAPTKGLEGYEIFASPDQYFARAGAMIVIGKSKNLAFSLAGRFEGIPAYDVVGGSVAYRRPGYVVAAEPGITYRVGQHTFSLFVPYNFYKNRIQSAADKASQDLTNSTITDPSKFVFKNGDAAFADYSISLGYSFRISKAVKVPTWNVN